MARRSRWIESLDLDDEIRRRTEMLIEGNKRALNVAAQKATEASQARFRRRRSGRPSVDPRRGRPTTEGAFPNLLVWSDERVGKHRYAQFQHEELSRNAPYWLIQEIGTGNAARVLDQGGRRVTVKSQRGRQISPSLSFADATGAYQAPDTTRVGQDQIVTLQQAKKVPIMPRRRIVIQREIQPKGFVRHGGRVGLRSYRRDLDQLMRQAFDRR